LRRKLHGVMVDVGDVLVVDVKSVRYILVSCELKKLNKIKTIKNKNEINKC